MAQLIECVPNFSEGRDLTIIKQITDVIESVEGVKLLDVDPGAATNRTVVTFVGEPQPVIEAAFLAIQKASELIDMRKHSGEHPRFGATDVCPLIPISGISMKEVVKYAHALGKRVGKEIGVPVYFYESAATEEKRKNLASVRAGEYEGIPAKIKKKEWKPDEGPAKFNASTGNVAIGARNFLIAYNVNLNTTSTRRANAVAFDIREQGRVMRTGNPITGKVVKNEAGEDLRVPGKLKGVKGIGWFIEEYGVAQVSMNITDISKCSLHEAYEACFESALDRGLRVTGSEIVGLVPLSAMMEAGRYYLSKQNRSLGVAESEVIKIAIKSMGLDELGSFDPNEKIIEYKMRQEGLNPLVNMRLNAFAHETASESPAPGGGSIAAYVGSLGAALGTMVANLSAHKRGWDDRWETYSQYAEQGDRIKDRLLQLVDADTHAFNKIIDAIRLPKASEEDKKLRSKAIVAATKNAIEVPYQIMETAFESFALLEAMASEGNPNSVSDAGVGALCARTAVLGAYLNVKINATDLKDKRWVDKKLKAAQSLVRKTKNAEKKILDIVSRKMRRK